jgi:hypothetical protein
MLLVPPPGPRSIRAFDPDRMAQLELDMWQAYYRGERVRLFRGLVATLREQYRCSYATGARVAFRFARAAMTFATATADYERVLPDLVGGYAIIRDHLQSDFDPAAVARAELAWWVARRVPGEDAPANVGRLIARENALLFGVADEVVLHASTLRARAGRLRDDGGARADWPAVARLLRQSYRELHVAVNRP